jgi:hypothetical protein
MQGVKRWGGAAIAASCAVALAGTPAYADTGDRYGGRDPIQVVADHLNDPFEISAGSGRTLYVTEVSIGQVTAIDPVRHTTKPVITDVGGATGAVKVGSQFAVLTGGPSEIMAAAPALTAKASDAAGVPVASVLLARPGKKPVQLADLLANELKNNPDGQTQFDADGNPMDSLSNPFYLINDRSGKGLVLVADGGGNAVLRVDRKGKVSNFFIPPVIKTGACADLPNNAPVPGTGCDPVPTGLAYGPRNTLYVSTLSSEIPGEGRVYVLDAYSGKVKRVISGLDAPTGVAVDWCGNVYVSELLENAPLEGPPPPGFDPSTVGRIVKIAPNGSKTYAQVTMPVGLLIDNGVLYSSAWSVAGMFFQTPNAGQIVRVNDSAFTSAEH